MKNGSTYISIVERADFVSGNWNPSSYRHGESEDKLSDFADVKRAEGRKTKGAVSPYAPIEYRDIPAGVFLTFSLTTLNPLDASPKYAFVKEQSLLFGTMRAYLGNVIVTPKASWVRKEHVTFTIKSEFVEIIPHDGLVYFWWNYLRSASFLSLMPAGDGGTRPRANAESLLNIPVTVPPLEERRKVNDKLLDLAEKAWDNYIQCLDLANDSNTNHEYYAGTN